MSEFALLNGKYVVRVIRKDHYGDKAFWLVKYAEHLHHMGFVEAKDCTPIDPALNILFERKQND